jgi:DNA polymerase (family 10)
MTNKQVAAQFNLLGKIMELYKENPFKIKSYSNAYLTIRKMEKEVISMDESELSQQQGIGKAISAKIVELGQTGKISALEKYLDKTPTGIVELLQIKGLGPKKIKQIWEELQIESPGELLYACNENRLVDLKGFGEKTQTGLIEKLSYFLDSKGSYLYGHIEKEGLELLEILKQKYADYQWDFCGLFERKMPVLTEISILTDYNLDNTFYECITEIEGIEYLEESKWSFKSVDVAFVQSTKDGFYLDKIMQSSSEYYLKNSPTYEKAESEQVIFSAAGQAFLPSESREWGSVVSWTQEKIDLLITEKDIKGVVHCHTTYSDGIHDLPTMVDTSAKMGYEYIVITDHSKSAFYANGLQIERLMMQIREIEALNNSRDDIKIFSGIESDILSDGSLDYPDDILDQLDVVIASIHSNLKMDEAKATTRLVKAIEHPATKILGHPTGRLLLSRKGYPIDYKKIIDACSANGVSIEVNANPYRLDLDWEWIPYAMEKGLQISINPDAHSTGGIKDIRYGVLAARKGLLTKDYTLNAKNTAEFTSWLKN